MPAQKTGVATKKKAVAPTPTPATEVPPAAATAEATTEATAEATAKATPEAEAAKPVVQNPVTAFQSRLNVYVERFTTMHKELKDLVNEGRSLEKEYNAIVKLMSKKTKFVKSTEDRPLSGFAMPSYLSDELYEFLGIDKGTKVPRKDVTKMMNDYIKSNNLRKEDDKRYIIPNSALQKIFRSVETDEISYFNLQKYMKHHFIKDSEMAGSAKVIAATA